MRHLIFIRHAQTDMAGRFCGHTDPPINARGAEQLSSLLLELRQHSINAVVSSDLQRAAATAAAIAHELHLALETTPALREMYFGQWENLTWAQIEELDPVYARTWLNAYPSATAPDGESFYAFQERVMNCVAELLVKTTADCIAVVTHAGVMRVILQRLCGCSPDEAWASTSKYCCTFAYSVMVPE